VAEVVTRAGAGALELLPLLPLLPLPLLRLSHPGSLAKA